MKKKFYNDRKKAMNTKSTTVTTDINAKTHYTLDGDNITISHYCCKVADELIRRLNENKSFEITMKRNKDVIKITNQQQNSLTEVTASGGKLLSKERTFSNMWELAAFICDYDYECYLEDMAAKAKAEAHMYEDDNLYDEYLMSLNGN